MELTLALKMVIFKLSGTIRNPMFKLISRTRFDVRIFLWVEWDNNMLQRRKHKVYFTRKDNNAINAKYCFWNMINQFSLFSLSYFPTLWLLCDNWLSGTFLETSFILDRDCRIYTKDFTTIDKGPSLIQRQFTLTILTNFNSNLRAIFSSLFLVTFYVLTSDISTPM